jgi:hypothetical protein
MHSQLHRLPERFPVGTRYVVEACRRGPGHFRVQSRYVEFPDGTHVDLPPSPRQPVDRQARGRRTRKK